MSGDEVDEEDEEDEEQEDSEAEDEDAGEEGTASMPYSELRKLTTISSSSCRKEAENWPDNL